MDNHPATVAKEKRLFYRHKRRSCRVALKKNLKINKGWSLRGDGMYRFHMWDRIIDLYLILGEGRCSFFDNYTYKKKRRETFYVM